MTKELKKIAEEPVMWRREWNGDDSDIGAYCYADNRDELDSDGPWEPLYSAEQVESACLQAIKAFCEREPTEKMYRAVDGKCDAYGFNHKSGKPEVTYETVQSIYKAMMQAALRELGE